MNILLIVLAIIELIMLLAISLQVVWNVRLHRSNKELAVTNKQLLGKINVFERTDLLMMLASTAAQAKKSIIHLTYTFHTPEEEEEMGPLLDAIRRVSRDQTLEINKKDIRFLGPSHPANTERLFCRHDAGATVRINDAVAFHDIRFQVVDEKFVVITVGDPSTKSRHGYLVESEYLGHMLTDHFNELWCDAKDYDDYMKQLVKEAKDALAKMSVKPTAKFLARKLGLNLKETQRLLKLINGKRGSEKNSTDAPS